MDSLINSTKKKPPTDSEQLVTLKLIKDIDDIDDIDDVSVKASATENDVNVNEADSNNETSFKTPPVKNNLRKRRREKKEEKPVKELKQPIKEAKQRKRAKKFSSSSADLEINLNRLNKSYQTNKLLNEKITSTDILTQILNDFFSNDNNFHNQSVENQTIIKNYSSLIQSHFNKLIDNNLLIENNLLTNLRNLNKKKNLLRNEIYNLRANYKKIQNLVTQLRMQNLHNKAVYLNDRTLNQRLKILNNVSHNKTVKPNQTTLINDINVKMIKLSRRTNPHFGLIDKIKLLNEKLKNYL